MKAFATTFRRIFVLLTLSIITLNANIANPLSVNEKIYNPDGAKEQCYILILGGGKTKAEAEKALLRFKMLMLPFSFNAGFPKTYSSETIEGLNPGFEIAVLGFYKNESDAKLHSQLVNSVSEDWSYYKKVNIEYSPGLSPDLKYFNIELSLIPKVFSEQVFVGMNSVSWELYKKNDSYTLAVKQDGKILAFKKFENERQLLESDEERGDAYHMVEWEFEPISLGQKNFILAKQTTWDYDMGETSHTLLAFNGSEIVSCIDFNYSFKEPVQGPPYSSAIISDYSENDWKKLLIEVSMQGIPYELEYYKWDQENFKYILEKKESIE